MGGGTKSRREIENLEGAGCVGESCADEKESVVASQHGGSTIVATAQLRMQAEDVGGRRGGRSPGGVECGEEEDGKGAWKGKSGMREGRGEREGRWEEEDCGVTQKYSWVNVVCVCVSVFLSVCGISIAGLGALSPPHALAFSILPLSALSRAHS